MLYPLRDSTGVSLSLSLSPSLPRHLYLSASTHSTLSVCLSIRSIFYTLHLSVNLIYFSTLHLSINLLMSPSLSLCPLHTSGLDAIRFQDDLKAACSFWANHAPKGTCRSWWNVSRICLSLSTRLPPVINNHGPGGPNNHGLGGNRYHTVTYLPPGTWPCKTAQHPP